MNVSSDALNTKENNEERTGNDGDRNSETQEGEGQQEIDKGDEASKGEESREGNQAEEHPIWQQGRESPGIDEAQGRCNPRGNRQSNRLAESQHSRVCEWAH